MQGVSRQGTDIRERRLKAISNAERMPHLGYHVLQGVGVFALSVLLVGDVKGCNNAHCYQQSLQSTILQVWKSMRAGAPPDEAALTL
jgi:hypothetical protein